MVFLGWWRQEIRSHSHLGSRLAWATESPDEPCPLPRHTHTHTNIVDGLCPKFYMPPLTCELSNSSLHHSYEHTYSVVHIIKSFKILIIFPSMQIIYPLGLCFSSQFVWIFCEEQRVYCLDFRFHNFLYDFLRGLDKKFLRDENVFKAILANILTSSIVV